MNEKGVVVKTWKWPAGHTTVTPVTKTDGYCTYCGDKNLWCEDGDSDEHGVYTYYCFACRTVSEIRNVIDVDSGKNLAGIAEFKELTE